MRRRSLALGASPIAPALTGGTAEAQAPVHDMVGSRVAGVLLSGVRRPRA